MTVIHGLPAHVLLVHFLVVLAPLTALLEIACALWPAARRGHLVWLTAILAVVTTALTPVTAMPVDGCMTCGATPTQSCASTPSSAIP